MAFVSGVLFAVGLALSGMTHPSKVLAFLDVAGDWDPSLLFVMGAGVLVNVVFFRWALRRGAPLLASSFALPERTAVDAPSSPARRSSGWGGGSAASARGPRSCPSLGGAASVVAFVAAMFAAMLVYGWTGAKSAPLAASGAVAEPTPRPHATSIDQRFRWKDAVFACRDRGVCVAKTAVLASGATVVGPKATVLPGYASRTNGRPALAQPRVPPVRL